MVPRKIVPGIIHSAKNAVSNASRASEKTYVLAMDGKKVAMGLTEEDGDVDMFGCEDGVILAARKHRFECEMASFDHEQDNDLITEAQNAIQIVSKRISDARDVRKKREYALTKFLKLGGDNWRKSRYIYVISAMFTSVYQIKDAISNALDSILSFLKISAHANDKEQDLAYAENSVVDLSYQSNYIELKCPDDLPEEFKLDSRFIKQGSEQWHDLRSRAPLTGSTAFKGLGLRTLKDMKMHIENIKSGTKETFDEETQKRLDHGRESEKHGVATLVSRILPTYFPGSVFHEEGAYFLTDEDSGRILMEVSPDGSLRVPSEDGGTKVHAGVEIKCPYPGQVYCTPVFYGVPTMYLIQILSEMKVLATDQLVLLCWTEESTTVFFAKFCEVTWGRIWAAVKHFYGQEKISKPCKVPDLSKELIQVLQCYAEQNVSFIAEVPSVKAKDRFLFSTSPDSPYLHAWVGANANGIRIESDLDVQHTLEKARKSVTEINHLTRQPASEVFLFMLSDTDRRHSMEIPHAIPVAYGMRAASMSTQATRNAMEVVLSHIEENDLNIICASFDGAFIRLVSRDAHDNPLTVLALQQDVWSSAKSMSKNDQIKYLRQLCIPEKQDNVVILASIIDTERVHHKLIVHSKHRALTDVRTPTAPACPKESQQNMNEAHEIPMEDFLPMEVVQQLARSEDHTIVNTIEQQFQNQPTQSDNAEIEMADVEDQIQDPPTTIPRRKRRITSPSSLSQLAVNVVQSKTFKKHTLNVVLAAYRFKDSLPEWQASCPLPNHILLAGTDDPMEISWFCHPEVRKGKPFCKVIDGHHIFVNLRACICRDAIIGIRREAWERVARSRTTDLTLPIVIDGVDKQSNAFARTMFAQNVEDKMNENGDFEEAKFCHTVRRWYEAEDAPGLDAVDRYQRRMEMRQYLLDGVSFETFPPPGTYMKGKY